MYLLFKTFNGSIENILKSATSSASSQSTDVVSEAHTALAASSTASSSNSNNKQLRATGWDVIKEVASLRKRVRKLNLQLRQVNQDIDSLKFNNSQTNQSDAAVNDNGNSNGNNHDGVSSGDAVVNSVIEGSDVIVEPMQRLGFTSDMGSLQDLEAKTALIHSDIAALVSSLIIYVLKYILMYPM
jgi:hypothetical protein